MSGLECSEILKGDLEESFRIDAEFFQKKYTFFADWVKTVKHTSLSKESLVARKGIFDVNASFYTDKGVPFVRISSLRNMLIDNANVVCIPQVIDVANMDTHLSYGDIVLSKTAIPAASFINLPDCNVSQDTVAIKLKPSSNLLSEFLVVFFNTKYGLAAMERRFTGNVQMHLNLVECKEKLLIPVFSSGLQQEIKELFTTAIDLFKNANIKYQEAGTLLLSTLALNDFIPSKENTSVKTFSQFKESGRLDAEYYHPKFDELMKRLHTHAEKMVLVKEIRTENHRGVQPDYIVGGEIAVVNSKNILENGLDYDNFSATSRELWELTQKAHIEKGDILIYTTGANVGRAALYRLRVPALASNHVNILRVTHKHPKYIAFVINSMIGRLQTERLSTGSAQQELYPSDIDNFLIPIVPEAKQAEIEALLDESHALREQSKALLKAATRAVEIAIEQNEANGMEFLEKARERNKEMGI